MTAENTSTNSSSSPTSVVVSENKNSAMETENDDPTTIVKPKALVDEDFFDKDDDEEQATDDPNEKKFSITLPAAKRSSSKDDSFFSPEILKMYYSRLFPYSLLCSWLNYKKLDPKNNDDNNGVGTKLFSNREFSFTIEPMKGQEIYLRYQSFHTQEEMMDSIKKRNPIKIDIGAVFNVPPKDSKSLQGSSGSSMNFKPVQRELVFDIDLTDYDEVRNCGCSGAQICRTCWVFMTCAMRVIHKGLKEDFGFQHVTWFYSGRRGVHCWVCDESARTLTNEGRNAIASYFEVALESKMKQGEQDEEKLNVQLSSGSQQYIHPMLQRSYDTLEPMFRKYVLPSSSNTHRDAIGGHGLLATKESWEKNVLNALPECAAPVRDVLQKKWNKDLDQTTPEQKWEQLKQHLEVFISREAAGESSKSRKKLANWEKFQLEHWHYQMVFKYTYPRLDINVSKTMNHLLKSPFCIHPKTGRVCVPIDITKIDSFDPFAVPTVSQLMKELDQIEECHNNGLLWQKTSLKQYFTPFQKQFLEPMLKEIH